jgi:CVNH domain
MRNLTMAGLIGFTILLGSACAAAQQVPSGSYQQTCREIGMNGNTLFATCQDTGGNWRSSQLPEVQSCSSQIVNDNGSLRCERSGNWRGDRGGVFDRDRDNDRDRDRDQRGRDSDDRGNWSYGNGNGTYGNGQYVGQYGGPDYTATCQNIRNNGNRIDARCQKRDGGWRDTTLKNANQCGGQIINDDGRLRCGAGTTGGYIGQYPGQYGVNGAGGDYVRTCRDIRNNGNRIDATCQTRDGNWRRTTLDNANQCSSSIVNDDGHLRCGR